MMRVLEFLVALLIVAGIGVVAGLASPGSGHVDRSLTVGKDLRQVYDVLDNFRRLPDYAVLRSRDRAIVFKHGEKSYGPGAEISWTSSNPKVGNGGLTIASATPSFEKVDSTTPKASIVWDLDNPWRGLDKHFTFDLARKGSRGQLTEITWSYDVKYGWNLINRFANLYIHGEPDSFIQGGLNNLQNVLASVPNIDYSKLVPSIVQTQPQPVLFISGSIERTQGLEGFDEAVGNAVTQLQAAAKKLGVNVIGPRIVITTNYGDQTFTFDVALPIDSSALTVNGITESLTAPTAPALDPGVPVDDAAASAEVAADAASKTGTRDRFGRLVLDNGVRATLAFGGAALKGVSNGTWAGVPLTRDMLKAYAQTHGYRFDDVTNRTYDVMVSAGAMGPSGEYTSYPKYDVYLPLSEAPAQTPEQAAGIEPPVMEAAPAPAATSSAPAAASSAPAAATSAAAPADAEPATAGTAAG